LNLQDVAKALFIEPSVILRYFGYALGTKTKIETDPKSAEIISIEINGEFHIDDTLKQLDNFIDEFILCGKCRLPEMALLVENEVAFGLCNSCGHETQIIQTHKLSKYLIKNPPKVFRDIKNRAGGPAQA
jgi:translation initiation factor 5